MDNLADFFANMNFSSFTFDLEYVTGTVVPVLNKGLVVSLTLIVPSIIMGFLFGVVIGAGRVYGPRRVRRLLDVHVTLVRGVPLLVQMFIIYFGLPSVGINLAPTLLGCLHLLCVLLPTTPNIFGARFYL